MIFYVLNRKMDVVASMSNETTGTMYIDDTSGGQTITLTNGCAIGSYDFKTDAHHDDSVYITAGNFIAFNDKYNRTRLYTIMTVNSDDELDVHCEDIGLDLINEMANARENSTDQTLEFYLNQVFSNSSWIVQYDTDGISTQTRSISYSSNSDTKLTRLQDIMTAFDFECDFEVEIKFMKVTKMIAHIYNRLNNVTEKDISQRFINDINLISLTRSEDITDLYTAVRVAGGTADNKTVTIRDIVYDDGQFWTPKDDDILYDRTNAEIYSRFAGTVDQNSIGYKYIYGYYSSSTTSAATLLQEAITELKSHSKVKLAYEAKLLDLEADLGDYITIVDNSRPNKVYLRARIQEVTNYYTQIGEDTGTLANYTIMPSTNGDTVRNLLNQIETKIGEILKSEVYYCLGDNGSYPPVDATWQDEAPEPTTTKPWIWVKTVTINTDGTEQIVYTVTKDYEKYRPISHIIHTYNEYWLNSSTDTLDNDPNWTIDQPSYVEGKYYWTRTAVVWSDGSVEYENVHYDEYATDAMKQLANAQTTANSKRRIFTTTPTPPYDVGDLYTQGSNGDIFVCKTAKTSSGTYSESDWELASNYTDDAIANLAREIANSAKDSADISNQKASNAQTIASEAKETADSNNTWISQEAKPKLETIESNIESQSTVLATVQKQLDEKASSKSVSDMNDIFEKLKDLEKHVSTLVNLANRTTIDETGVKIASAIDGKTYIQLQYNGLHTFVNGTQSAEYLATGMNSKYAFFNKGRIGNHIIDTFTIGGVEGTAFFYYK